MASKSDNSAIENEELSPNTKFPVRTLAHNTKGINGGKLILLQAKAITLLSRKKIAKKITITVWKPHKGDNPKKTPSAIESAFFLLLSPLPRKSSTKNFLNPFFLIAERNHAE